MWNYFLIYIFVTVFLSEVLCKVNLPETLVQVAFKKPDLTTASYVFWPNATVPFYVNPDNFDHEQSLAILQSLSMFAFRTCLKFAPVMAAPGSNEHVLVLENPTGIRRCVFDTLGHSVFEPHRVVIGYDCLSSPQIDMAIMRALGFPFEHNRLNRNVYVDILEENIEPSFIDLFTKENSLPIELRAIPYDINSVMHFGERDYSKNGHRTIMFKDHNMQQSRLGLTKSDLRRIEVVYGPQCRARDREEKIQLCQSYPGVARKKRDVDSVSDNVDVTKRPETDTKKGDTELELDDIEVSTKGNEINRNKRDVESVDNLEVSSKAPEIDRKKRDVEIVTKSLRVNPEITPPPDTIKQTLTELGIDDAVQEVVEQVYKVSALALNNARQKYCNNSKPDLRTIDDKDNQKNTDILGIIELIAHYAQGMVEHAVANLTKFCEESETIEVYQRARCSFYDGGAGCRQSYKSTKSGNVRYSTQHRPVYIQSTNIRGLKEGRNIYGRLRASSDSEETTTETLRRKRAVEDVMEEKKDDNPSLEIQSRKDDEQGKHEHKDIEQNDKKEEHVDKEQNEKDEREKDKEVKKDKKDTENGEKEDEKVLRAGTAIPFLKSHRYEAVRRRSRSRVKYALNEEDNDRSSLSTETERPQKHIQPEESLKHHRQSVKTKKHHKQSIEESDQRQSVEVEKQNESDESQRESKEMEKEKDFSDEEVNTKYKETTEAEVRWTTKRTKKRKEEKKYKEIEKATERYHHKTVERKETIPDIVTLSKANRDFYNDRKWPGGVVRYIIKEDTTYDTNDLRRRLAEVNSILKKKTCVRMKEITEEQAQQLEDYVVIDNSPDYVTGRVGGRQNFGSIELFRGDQHRQHTAMMVMALLGFYFEVSRHDRDKYVRVHLRHVRPDKLHHFEKIRKDATLPLPYDYASATQPAWQYWRQLGRTGISTVATYKQQDPDGSIMKSMGQNAKLLSDIDIVKINSVYGNKCFNSPRSKPNENDTDILQKPTKKSKPRGHIKEVTIVSHFFK